MSIEQMRLYQAYVTKSLEAKEAQEAFFAAADLESNVDSSVSDALRDVRETLGEPKYRLSGSECVLLASLSKLLEGEEYIGYQAY